jgi:hypothetical protein
MKPEKLNAYCYLKMTTKGRARFTTCVQNHTSNTHTIAEKGKMNLKGFKSKRIKKKK